MNLFSPPFHFMGRPQAGSAVTPNSFNPVDTSAAVIMSNGNLTLLRDTSAINNGDSSRTFASHSSGKYYCEVTIDVPGSTDSVAAGISNGSYTITNNNLGGDSASAAYYSDGHIYGNTGGGSLLNTGITFTTGDVIGYDVDVDAKTMRIRKNGGSFSATADLSFITGAWFFTGFVFRDGTPVSSQITANFGPTYGTAAPGGSGNW